MEKLTLTYIGTDSWSRPVYKDESEKLFKDVNCDSGILEICTVCGDFEGEPNTSIAHLDRYKNLEIEIIGRENEPTKEEKFNYQMLNRLKSDCDYYLGHGNRCKKRLWAGCEEDHIDEMKKIYNWFDDDKKPEWLTWNNIIQYECEMIK